MTEKELKKLNRKQLLELLLVQTEKADSLALELEEVRKKLEDKIIIQKEAGSIAEASMKLNEVFLSAQCAANQYLENIKLQNEKAILLENELKSEREKLEKEREELKNKLEEIEKLEKSRIIPLYDETASVGKFIASSSKKKTNIQKKESNKSHKKIKKKRKKNI